MQLCNLYLPNTFSSSTPNLEPQVITNVREPNEGIHKMSSGKHEPLSGKALIQLIVVTGGNKNN